MDIFKIKSLMFFKSNRDDGTTIIFEYFVIKRSFVSSQKILYRYHHLYPLKSHINQMLELFNMGSIS